MDTWILNPRNPCVLKCYHLNKAKSQMPIKMVFRNLHFIMIVASIIVHLHCDSAKDETHSRFDIGPAETPSETILELIRNAKTFDDLFEPDTINLNFPSDLVVGDIREIHVLKTGEILISDWQYANMALLFAQDGEFIRQIGAQGQGPGEYRSPMFLSSTSNNEIVIGDPGLRRITFYSLKGEYLHSFHFEHPISDMVVTPSNKVLIHNTIGMMVEGEKTIWVYNFEGKLLNRFGRRSSIADKISKIVTQIFEGPFLIADENAYYEMDFADYHIRKYWDEGKSSLIFGQQPEQWRSLAAVEESFSQKGLITPEKFRRIRNFVKDEFPKYSFVYGFHFLSPGILAVLNYNGEKSGFSNQIYYDFYTTNGTLIREGVILQGELVDEARKRKMIHVSLPDKLFFVRYAERNGDIATQLILMQLKENDESI